MDEAHVINNLDLLRDLTHFRSREKLWYQSVFLSFPLYTLNIFCLIIFLLLLLSLIGTHLYYIKFLFEVRMIFVHLKASAVKHRLYDIKFVSNIWLLDAILDIKWELMIRILTYMLYQMQCVFMKIFKRISLHIKVTFHVKKELP